MVNTTGNWIVITGDPGSGFTVYGPFGCTQDALDWAGRLVNDWWIDELLKPE